MYHRGNYDAECPFLKDRVYNKGHKQEHHFEVGFKHKVCIDWPPPTPQGNASHSNSRTEAACLKIIYQKFKDL